MAAVVKVEQFAVDVTTSGSTHTLANSVGSLSSGFVRRTTSIDKQSGPTTTTNNTGPDDASCGAYLTDPSTITFQKDTAISQKVVGEVWRYTGAVGGVDEFIVRGRYAITLSGTTASQAVSGIVNRDKCIPFWTGTNNPNTSTSDYDSSTVSVYIDGSDNIQIERGANRGTLIVYVTVVEFTGSNWSVGHGRSASHNSVAETATLNTASTGTGGSTFDVIDWGKAMIIEASLEADTGETGISDNLGVWFPAGSTTQATFTHLQDTAARNDGVAYCHVLAHPGMIVNRETDTAFAETNGTIGTTSFPVGSSTTESIDELALEWFADTSGTGSSHARGRVSGWITDPAGTISHWVHQSGNDIRVDRGIVELAAIDGVVKLVITDVDTDEIITNNQLNVVVTAASGGFEAVQGTGKVELVQFVNYTGTIINQLNIDSWSDTSIQFDVTSGALANTDCYLFVTSDSGAFGSIPITVGTPPETYQEAIEGIIPEPDHYWPFQNAHTDVKGTANSNGAAENGVTFPTTVIVKGDTHSLLIDSITDHCSPEDQTTTNISSNTTRRYMGGWIQLDRLIQPLSVIWEEGSHVNNYCLLVGYGNFAMWQFADDQGDYVQAYHDIKLTPGRPYHVMMEFKSSTSGDSICGCYLDGVLQSLTNGNPWEVAQFPSHSGNVTWGHEGVEELQTGDSRGVDNVDIAFASPVNCNYAHWYSWNNADPSTEIRPVMFAKGALALYTISAATTALMQTDLDTQLADTLVTDWPCGIEIGQSTDEASFALTFDNITFEDRVSMPVRYMGSGTLTLVMANGADIDESKCEAPYGGTIVVQRPALVTWSGQPDGTTIVVQDAIDESELDRVQSSVGNFVTTVSAANINYVIIADDFKPLIVRDAAISGDTIIPVVLDNDYSYENP